MADRVTRVSLVAQVTDYLTGMQQAARATQATGDAARTAQQRLEAQGQAMDKIGKGLMAIGAVAAVGVGLAITKFAEFDQAMSEVQASTHESEENMNLLRDAAIEAGASTVFTATEAANAIDELSKAGVSASDVLGGALAGALSLASAGGLGVADAAEIAATALTQFKLKGADIPHVADLLAAGAGKAQGSVEDLSQALNQGGLVAAQAGFSIEETTGALAAFASAGLVGSDAGTSLKTAILALQNPVGQGAKAMKEYNIDVYDGNGKMLSFAGIADQLQSNLGGLSDETRNAALAQIFGNDAVRSASILYSEGAVGIEDWNSKVNDAGYAAETARIKLDNLNGDIEKFGGAVDTAFIKSGSAANDSLRMLTQLATGAVDAFSSLPGPVLAVALGLGVVTAGVGLLGGGMLTLIPKIAATRVAMQDMNMTAGGLAKSIGKGGLLMAALTLATVGASGLGKVGELAAEDLAKLDVAINAIDTADSLDGLFTGMQGTMNATNGVAEAANKLTSSGLEGWLYSLNKGAWGATSSLLGWIPAIKDLDNGITKNEAQFKALGTTLATLSTTDVPAASKSFNDMVEMLGGGNEATEKLLEIMPDYKAALIEQAAAAGVVVTGTDEAANKTALLEYAQRVAAPTALDAADAYLEMATQAEDLTEQITQLLDSFNELNEVNQSAVQANAAYQSSLEGIAEEVQKQKDAFISLQEDGYKATHDSLDGFVGTLDGFTLTLDESTAAGSAMAEMLSSVAVDAQAAAEAQYEVDKTTMSAKDATDKYVGTLGGSREALRLGAEAAGFNAEQVQALIDKVYALPTQKQIDILANTASAVADLDALIATYGKKVLYLKVMPTEIPAGPYKPGMAPLPGKASGGAIEGPGTGTSDTAGLYRLSNGEHVLTTEEVGLMGGQAAVYAFRDSLSNRGYADGGAVQYASNHLGGGHVMRPAPVAPAAPLQQVSETIVLELDGKTVWESNRMYVRSIS